MPVRPSAPAWAVPAGALLAALLAAWLGATVMVWWSAAGTFQALSPARNPGLAQRLAPLEPARREAFLRFAAGEVNRRMFRGWARAQAVLAALALAAAWAAPRLAGGGTGLRICLALLALTAALQALWLSPEIERLGLELDRAREEAALRRFGLLHAAFSVTDLVKAALLAAGIWMSRKRESPIGISA
ncbi:MAG: hypothetical protein HYZ11_18495 [Candidatus Tectomicrobia bacterium]|uniref:DUF4149 domain-containing protein n=1 Tax=Tectimicrobiota bacterium TaxID=2528274 RepID=A0A932I3W5_UNCTE|nr:hypothetical protein [Candidatus Tectomicrobia bacterium]